MITKNGQVSNGNGNSVDVKLLGGRCWKLCYRKEGLRQTGNFFGFFRVLNIEDVTGKKPITNKAVFRIALRNTNVDTLDVMKRKFRGNSFSRLPKNPEFEQWDLYEVVFELKEGKISNATKFFEALENDFCRAHRDSREAAKTATV